MWFQCVSSQSHSSQASAIVAICQTAICPKHLLMAVAQYEDSGFIQQTNTVDQLYDAGINDRMQIILFAHN